MQPGSHWRSAAPWIRRGPTLPERRRAEERKPQASGPSSERDSKGGKGTLSVLGWRFFLVCFVFFCKCLVVHSSWLCFFGVEEVVTISFEGNSHNTVWLGSFEKDWIQQIGVSKNLYQAARSFTRLYEVMNGFEHLQRSVTFFAPRGPEMFDST